MSFGKIPGGVLGVPCYGFVETIVKVGVGMEEFAVSFHFFGC